MILLERRELLDGFRKGDQRALAEVYRHYVRDVSRFLVNGFSFDSAGKMCAFRGFRGGYEVEAAIQEVFRRAFEERARLAYDGIHPYRPYLLRIARNAVINDLKSRHPILFRFRTGRPVLLESPEMKEAEDFATADLSPEELLESREVGELVARFRAALDAREQGVFACRFEEGLSAEEAGKKLALSRSQVRTTEAKLRERFLEHMRASGYLAHYKSGGAVDASSALAMSMLLALVAGGMR